jgi:hypothetical protein
MPVAHQEYSPRAGQHYHCPICRIPLRFDPILNRMTLAPFFDDASPAAPPAADLIPDRRDGSQDRRQQHRGGRRAWDAISKR